MPDLEQKARERFEKWAKEECPRLPLYKLDDGRYSWVHAIWAFAAWQESQRSIVSEIVSKMQERSELSDQERIDLYTLMSQWSRNLELQAQKVGEWYRFRSERQVAELKKEYGV